MGDSSAPHIVDVDLNARQVQALGSADAVAALFSELGYRTGARLNQTPASIGITTPSVARPIRRLELVADRDVVRLRHRRPRHIHNLCLGDLLRRGDGGGSAYS